jgi:hypothetical protein
VLLVYSRTWTVHRHAPSLSGLSRLDDGDRLTMIREAAARKLARQLLEPRISRVNPLSEEFIKTVAQVIMTYVHGDEQAQRAEKLAGGKQADESPR